MTPRELMLNRRAPLRLVIFDCDGVLVDSEPVSNRILAEELTALGWPLTSDEATSHFLGLAVPDIRLAIEARLGRGVTEEWAIAVVRRIAATLAEEAAAVPGALEALRGVSALGVPWRVASNSSHDEMRAKFACLAMTEIVAGRVHSFTEVARGKPAPDLFLAAAAAEGVRPDECLVVEDSIAGARAAFAAGMDCLGLDRHGDGSALRAVGAVPFHAMAELPALIALATETVP